MRDLRRISLLTVILLVLLRISIGWHLLYEGLWKYNTLNSPQPWSAEGYLRNAQGPMRDYFRGLTGDPDDLKWLDYDLVSTRWDNWRDQFVAHYGLTEDQQRDLDLLLDGPKEHAQPLEALPESVATEDLPRIVRFDADRKRLMTDGPLLPEEIDEIQSLVPVERKAGGEITGGTEQERKFYEAVETLGIRSQRLSFRQRLKALLLGDPERLGATAVQDENNPLRYRPETGTILSDDGTTVLLKYGEIQRYRDMLDDYHEQVARAETDYQQAHLEKLWQVIQQKRVQLVQPVIQLEQELQSDAWKMLKPEQLAQGQLDWDDRPVQRINRITIWSLLVLGGLLIAGLCTPVAAVAAAGMLMMFYLAIPPFPGVPQPPGPDHTLFVNKNFIEALALLVIAASPTGRWFGIDGLFARFFGRDFE